MTKTEFLLTILIQYQADKRWEYGKTLITGLLVDWIPNSPNLNITRTIWQTVGRITNKILGVKGEGPSPMSQMLVAYICSYKSDLIYQLVLIS